MAFNFVDGARKPALVGRTHEILRLKRLMVGARAGAAVNVAISGEAGIGKTRVLDDLCEHATTAGLDILTGRGSELEREIPFGLIVDSLDKRFGALDSGVLALLGPGRLSGLASVLPSLARHRVNELPRWSVERFEFYHAVRATFEQIVQQRPLLYVLDDVHWADPASSELIGFLLRHSVPGMMLALAYRPRLRPDQLRDAVARAEREDSLSVLELTPLTLEESAEALGEAPDSFALQLLHAESGGNPFYLEQLARAAAEKSPATPMLSAASGDNVEISIPGALRTSLAYELNSLTTATLAILQAGAVAGDPFDVELVAAIAETDETSVLRGLDDLVALDLVRTTTGAGHFRFRHPIVRRVVYDNLRPGWRYSAHKRAARALARRGASLSACAHHVEHSAIPGDEAAVALLTEAGKSVVLCAPAAAARWFVAALRLLPPTAEAEKRLHLTISLADALACSGWLHESRTTLERALEFVPSDSHRTEAQIICVLVATLHGLGFADEAEPLIAKALDQVTPGSVEAFRLELELAENHLMTGEWELAVQAAIRADLGARGFGDSMSTTLTTSWLARATTLQGDISRAQALADQVARSIDAGHTFFTPELLEPLANLVDTEIGLDRIRAAARHAERGLKLSRATGQGYLSIRFMVGTASTSLLLGQLTEARSAAVAASEAARLLRNDQLHMIAETIRCLVESTSGDFPAALAAGRAAVQAADRLPHAHYSWAAHVCYGEVLIAAGEFERGRQEILSIGGSDLLDMPPPARPFWYPALVTAELDLGRIEAAEELTRRCETSTQGLLSRVAQAHYARARMHTAQGKFRAAVGSARQAFESFDAAGMRVWAERARLDLGRALARAGESDAALRELELAHSILRDIGAARLADEAAKELRTLGRRVRRRPPAGCSPDSSTLTEREREIGYRVARGYTNREIAGDLFISPKTVEKHIARLFVKLGTSSRAGVAAAMGRSAAPGRAPGR